MGSPSGNEPYKTVRAKNWANLDETGSMSDSNIGADAGKAAEDLDKTQMIGNVAGGSATKPEPKPSQGA